MTEFELGAEILVSKHPELNKSACGCVSEIQRVVSNEKRDKLLERKPREGKQRIGDITYLCRC